MPRTRKLHDESTKRAALNALAKGEPPGKVATAFSVPRTTLYRWIEADKQASGAARASAQRVTIAASCNGCAPRIDRYGKSSPR
jgi:transposase-like protein